MGKSFEVIKMSYFAFFLQSEEVPFSVQNVNYLIYFLKNQWKPCSLSDGQLLGSLERNRGDGYSHSELAGPH